jgi:hypothetical protein
VQNMKLQNSNYFKLFQTKPKFQIIKTIF